MKRHAPIIVTTCALILLGLFVVAPLYAAGSREQESKGNVELLYVEWAGEIATTNVAAIVLEEMGYDVTITAVSAAAMWEGIAGGDGDGMLAAWLPGTHGQYLSQRQDRLDLLSTLMDGARIGLMVPTYVDIDSVAELADHADRFNSEIIGIDPGAGLMSATETAMEVYGLDGFRLIEGSDATMTAALSDAISNEEWVVVTGWTPHWKEVAFELKYLDDPELVFGEAEHVAAVARLGLAEEMPEVHAFLDNFYITVEQLGQMLLWNEERGADPRETAQRWVSENRETVDSWIPVS